MVLATLGALAGSYAMEKASQASQNVSAKKSAKAQAIYQDWLNQQQFTRQTKWEKEKMLNAYQWTMQDMKNAGLNPILGMSQNGATSASAPSGAGGSSALANTRGMNLTEAFTNMNNAYIQRRALENNTAKNNAEIALKDAQTLNTLENTKWIDDKTRQELRESASRIAKNATSSAKDVADTNRQNAETQAVEGGLLSKIMGTNPNAVQGAVNGLALIGGGGAFGAAMKGYKALKTVNTAKNFGRFIESIGR